MRNAFFDLVATSLICGCCCCGGCNPASLQEPLEYGGMLVYECTPSGGGCDLYVTDLQSGESTNLTGTWKISSPCRPSFCPDGRHIVFQGRESGKWNIYMYDITDGRLPECLTEETDADCMCPSLSSDGKSLLFVRNGQIAVMDMETRKVRALTFDAGATYAGPVFADSGKAVIYEYTTGGKTQLGRLDTATLSSSGILFDAESNNCRPVVAGGSLIYINRTSAGASSLMSATVSGTNPARIYSDGVSRFDDPCPYRGGYILVCNAEGGMSAIGRHDSRIYRMQAVTEGTAAHPAYCDCTVEVARPENGGRQEEDGDNITSDTERPALKGKLVYHSYTSYDAGDSRMYIYDFSKDTVTEISRGWTGVSNMMNGHFSPDGRYVTFMGIGSRTASWDIFLYDLDGGGQPVNLTPEGSYRDEDPKFSHSGSTIVFKREGHLAEITVATGAIKVLSRNNSEEYGMPYYNSDDTKILSGVGEGSAAYIGVWDKASSTMSVIFDRKGENDYYPVNIDRDAFYFTTHETGSAYDQLYKGFWNGASAVRLAFNKNNADYSDACPVSKGWLFLVSSRSGGRGMYDLYIAHETSGAIYSLSLYNSGLNTAKNELGPAYFVEKQ